MQPEPDRMADFPLEVYLMKAFAVVAAVTLLAGCGGDDASRAAQSGAPPIVPALSLTEAGGRTLDLAAERGRVVVIFFGYTNCPDVCPTTMADFVSVKQRLGARAADVRFAFVTVDPARDTPEAARRYAAGFDSTFYGLSGDSATLVAVQHTFRVAAWTERDSTGQVLVAHSASVFIVGKDGTLGNQVFFNNTRGEALYQAVLAALEA